MSTADDPSIEPGAAPGSPAGEELRFFTGDMSAGRVGVRVHFDALPGSTAPTGYLTPQDEFGVVERGNPLPYTLPLGRRREIGMERETWTLEVVADPESDTKIEQPL